MPEPKIEKKGDKNMYICPSHNYPISEEICASRVKRGFRTCRRCKRRKRVLIKEREDNE